MLFERCVRWRRLFLLACVFGLLMAIPLNPAYAQDPESTDQESNDRLLVVGSVIALIAAYSAVFVGEDADSRGKDGFQWGIAFFLIVCTAPFAYFLLADGERDDDTLLMGAVIFAAALSLTLGIYYLVLRPQRFRFL